MNVQLIDKMGSDLSVVNAARVSFAKQSQYEFIDFDVEALNEKDQKLIAYLAKHNHWSPFAHTCLSFRIKAPIFVARQMAKHQVGGAWNEVSRRYVDDEPEFYFPGVWRDRAENTKQGSGARTIPADNEFLWITESDNYTLISHRDIVESCLRWYKNAIECGVAPEQARMILPQSTMTEWIWTGSLQFFARVCNLRLDACTERMPRPSFFNRKEHSSLF
jgi:thymidylate synthase (FAD)